MRIKSFLSTMMLASLVTCHALAQQPISGTLKDTNSGNSYTVTITPVVVTPTPTPTPDPVAVPDPGPPQAETGIPLTFDAEQFSGNSVAPSTRVPSGGSIKNKTITDTGQTASIVTTGAATVDTVRINSREGVRIGGGGTVTISNSYISVNGTGQDHADGIQTYSPGSSGVLRIRNTTIACGIEQATAGLFVADGWSGTVDLENVVIQGGPYGARIHPDGKNIDVRFKNVYVVGPFKYDGLWIDTRVFRNGQPIASGTAPKSTDSRNKVSLWENVCEAKIVGGKPVCVKAIPKPI